MDRKALDAWPAYPPDLDKWVIPKDEISLPADIYSEDMLIIDDGYDRSQLNIPGVMHIECGARWALDRSDAGSPPGQLQQIGLLSPSVSARQPPQRFPVRCHGFADGCCHAGCPGGNAGNGRPCG